MKLRSKLTVAFGALATITLAVSLLGYFEVRRLGRALYEIGTVRLPSIQGLEKINEAKTDLASSLRVMIATNGQPEVLAAESERQRHAWGRATAGWNLYEPLPQTPDEAVAWKKFLAAWQEWKGEYETLVTLASQNREGGALTRVREAHAAMNAGSFVAVATLLEQLLAINHEIAANAKAQSISTREDMVNVQRFMILAALAGVVSAIGLGIGMGHRLSRPMAEAARVLSRIARGEFSARMNFSSDDEIGEMATAMNSMAVTLHNAETRFAEIFNHTTDALFFIRVTAEGRFMYEDFNPAAVRATGLARDKSRDRDIAELLPPAVAAQVINNYKRCVAAGGPIGHEEEISFPPGRRCFNTLLVPVADASGRVVRIAGFARDVTERRQAERTRHALEAQLRQAQKLEAVGQLAAGVAHDFNNILAAIMLHLDIVRTQSGLPQGIREDLEQLADGAKRGAKVTRQLLLFSRKAVMRREVIDLNSLFTDLLKMLRRLIGEQVEIEFSPADEKPLVHADAGMLEQVVMNLVVNARDAMPAGGRVILAIDHIDVAAGRVRNEQAAAGRYVRLAVTDTGCGMSAEIIAKIFEPFFTTKGPEKGTGLGLSTVFGIAQEHGGWVDVKSAVGEGSTFSVFLPMHLGPPVPAQTATPFEETEGGGETILVAEDDDSVRIATVLILRSYGYCVFEAADEAAAKSILRNTGLPIDLVLSDVALPGGFFGSQLAADLNARKPRPEVILMSGFNPELHHAENVGVHTYLPKPFDSSLLLRTVHGCLESRSRGRGS